MDDELALALARLFVSMWDIPGSDEYFCDSVLVEEVVATTEDVENGKAPEGTEQGDHYYVLSKIGERAFDFVRERK